MIISELQELNDISTVSRSAGSGGDGICIAVTPDRNRAGEEYFRAYNAFSALKAEKMIRILFRKPEYVFIGNRRADDWILSLSEKRELVQFLRKEAMLTDSLGIVHHVPVFQKAIVLFNYERGLGDSPEEAFSLMLESDRQGYLPLSLEMPDYTALEQLCPLENASPSGAHSLAEEHLFSATGRK